MLTYFIAAIGIFVLFSFAILDRLRAIQRTLLQHSEMLENLDTSESKERANRRMFQPGGHPPKTLIVTMLAPYHTVMTDEQNLRYRQWLLGKDHEPFTLQEVRELEKSRAVGESR
jgi:hypothetical protein